MALRLIVTEDAEFGILQITTYIAEWSPQRARRYVQELYQALNHLLTFPETYQRLNPNKDPLTRRMVFQINTIVLYHFDDEAVYIDAVHDARSDWRQE